MRDLIGVDYDTTSEFPADDTGHGFDNIGDVLTLSPLLLEKYITAAKAIVSAAVPMSSTTVAEQTIAGRTFSRAGQSRDRRERRRASVVVVLPASDGFELDSRRACRPLPACRGSDGQRAIRGRRL